jgi:hypothetical protein
VVWLSLVLLLVAFQRGWVLAPMVLFAFPFVLPVISAPLVQSGVDITYVMPDLVRGYGAQLVSVGGLFVLSLYQRRS